ncbi:MAG: oligosaccharide flippase family protein [Chloroflexota bacterium]
MLSRLRQLYQRITSNPSVMATIIYMVGLVMAYGLRFVSLRIFTRLLTPEEIGIIAIFGSWVGIFTIILNLNLRSAVLNAITDYSETDFNEFISSIMTLGLLASIVMSVIILLLPDVIYETVFGLNRTLISFALLVSTIQFGTIFTVQIWRSSNQAVSYSLQLILDSGYSIIISVVFIFGSYFFLSVSALDARIFGMHITTMGFGIYFIFRRLQQGKVFFHQEYWRYALRLSIPLMGHLLSTRVLNRADQILIQSLVGAYETGLYSLAYRVGEIPSVLLMAFGSVWGVWFFNHMKAEAYTRIRRFSLLYALGFGAIILMLFAVGPFIYRFVTPEEYWVAIRLIPVIMVGAYWFMLYTLFSVAEQYDKRPIFLTTATFVAAIFNIVANLILIPQYGYEIAAWTTVASYALMYLMHLLVVIFVLRRANLFSLIALTLLGIVITLIAGAIYVAS